VAVLLAGGILSLGAWAFAHRLLQQKAQVLFKAEVDREEESLAGRLDQNLEVLRAGQALFDVDDDVTPAEWEAFAIRFGIRKRLDGMRSIGYVALLPPAATAPFEEAQKRLNPKFKLHGKGPGPYTAPLTLMYPWSDETRNLLGLDIFSLDARRAAILQAVESGEAIITDPLHLASVSAGNKKHPGVVIYAPVYRRGAAVGTVEARRAAARGVVFTSYYADELLLHTLRVHPELRVMVVDGPADDINRMLFESRPSKGRSHFHFDSSRMLGGRTWSIHYEAPRTFGVGDEIHAPRWVLAGGLLATLILAALTRVLALRRLKEERLVAELTESEARFRAVAETTDGAILLYWDTISYANPGAANILGIDREALIGKPALDLIHPDDRAIAGETLEARKAGEERPRRWEFRILRPDGGIRWVDLTATTVLFQGKRLVLATALDITERIAAEAARGEIEQKLFEARRMQSLGLIAGGLSHDFNNLVTTIQGNLSCAELELPEHAPARPFLEHIRVACLRATELTHAMLAYAGDAHFRWQRLDLNGLVRDVVAHELGALRAEQDIATDLADGLPGLEGDPDQLAHALRELLENGLEAMPGGGTARIATGVEPVDLASLDFDFFDPDSTVGACLWLSVSDSGMGMDLEVQRHMFDPFFSTKFAGRGLGLASVHGIMRSHHGGIRVACRPGQGTRVTLFFPVQGRDAASI
jgi:PAS domain S-box-containing protein